MSFEHCHDVVPISIHRKWTRRNMILDGSIIGTWTLDANLMALNPLNFVMDYVKDNLKSVLACMLERTESAHVLPRLVLLTDENDEFILEEREVIKTFLKTRKQQYVTGRHVVLRDVCEDAFDTKIDDETLWQTLQTSKSAAIFKCLKQLVRDNNTMNQRWGYLFDVIPTDQIGPSLLKSLADCFIILTEKHGPSTKLFINMLNIWFSGDSERCTTCCSQWVTHATTLLNSDDKNLMASLPSEWRTMANAFFEDLHPTDFCILLLTMGRSQLINNWDKVTEMFTKTFRSGNVGVNTLLIALASDVNGVENIPFFCSEASLHPTISGSYRYLCAKWPSDTKMIPSYVWVCAKAYHLMVVTSADAAFGRMKTALETSIPYSTNTPFRLHLEKKDDKTNQKMVDTFAYNLKNITGRSEFARVCLNASSFISISSLLHFVAQSTQPYYDLFVAEPKAIPISKVLCKQ